jgi:hypothetical protein
VIGINEVWSVHLVSRLPCIICIWIPLSLNEVLECSGPPKVSVINDTFYFIFLFSFQEVR